ncbi:hypothetical protein Dimus_012736 [Dionaea muscipula]
MTITSISPISVIIFMFFLQSTTSLQYPEVIYSIAQEPTGPHFFHPPFGLPPYPSPSSQANPLVPAFFVLGDSSVDCGTNNYLGTLARADRLPYGRDFDTHRPTGRFCNGRIPVDYLALKLGLPFVPSYLGQAGTMEDMIHGVNFASAGAGIIFSSGSELGQHISFTQQIQQVTDTCQQFMLSMAVQTRYLPWGFNHFLATTMKQEIKNLHATSVRNIVVTGLAPMGCAPYYLWRYRSKDGECISEINDMIMEFNFAMRYMVQELIQELPNANIIFCDVFEASMDIIKNFQQFGFRVSTDACCGLGKYKGWILCLSPEMACEDASIHIWWDQFHPTDKVNAILADNIWSGLHTNMCYPMNMKDMVILASEKPPKDASFAPPSLLFY